MPKPASWLAAVPLLLAGCVSPAALDLGGEPGAIATLPPLAFTPPVKLTGGGYGYEPSIEVGPDGTLYATAHKASLTHEGTRLASWLWYSRDNGTTWKEMPTPAQLHDKLFAFEGDLAVDAKGRIYFVDTYAPDNTLSRWSTTPDGPKWDFTRPIHGTLGVDDRPWLAAQGDGIVYYMGNNGGALPAPNALLSGRADPSRIWVYTSTDGGSTWSLGHGFPGAVWCGLAASPADDVTAYVGCRMSDGTMVVQKSADRGRTWTATEVGECEIGCGVNFPSIATDAEGRASFAWIDGTPSKQKGSTLHVARERDDGTFRTLDVTPMEGTFGMVWAAGGAPGELAITFYGTEDRKTDASSEWHAYALVTRDADADVPSWSFTKVDPEAVRTAAYPPGDFFQNVIEANGVVHVAYQRDQAAPPGYLTAADILHVRQILDAEGAGDVEGS